MNLKKMAAIEAVKHIESGMVIGLGTGSTAYYVIEEVGRRIREENLSIIGVPTSYTSKKHAEKLEIPTRELDEVSKINITIDGADEVTRNFYGIKGGGGAHLLEKIVATYSDKIVWTVDESKIVEKIGKFALPVEVIPYGEKKVFEHLSSKGYSPIFRMEKDKMKVTDFGNHIIDLHLNNINNPTELALELDQITGVVEHGLFLNMVDLVIIGSTNGIKTMTNKKSN